MIVLPNIIVLNNERDHQVTHMPVWVICNEGHISDIAVWCTILYSLIFRLSGPMANEADQIKTVSIAATVNSEIFTKLLFSSIVLKDILVMLQIRD